SPIGRVLCPRLRECPGNLLLGLSFFLRPPPDPGSTLFPYTTLFRSSAHLGARGAVASGDARSARGDGRRHDAARCRRAVLCQLRSEEHTSELQSREKLVCRLLLEKKKG